MCLSTHSLYQFYNSTEIKKKLSTKSSSYLIFRDSTDFMGWSVRRGPSGSSSFFGCWFRHDFLRMTKFFWQSGLIDMISFKDLNGIVCQLFTSHHSLTLFPWFHNVKIVKGIQIFTIFLRYLYNKSRYPLSNLRLCYLRTSANWSTHKICAISKNEIWWRFGW